MITATDELGRGVKRAVAAVDGVSSVEEGASGQTA